MKKKSPPDIPGVTLSLCLEDINKKGLYGHVILINDTLTEIIAEDYLFLQVNESNLRWLDILSNPFISKMLEIAGML